MSDQANPESKMNSDPAAKAEESKPVQEGEPQAQEGGGAAQVQTGKPDSEILTDEEAIAAYRREIIFTIFPKGEDVLRAAQMANVRKRYASRTLFQICGVVVLFIMFGSDILKNPGHLFSWLMLAVGLGLLALVWLMPGQRTKQYVAQRTPAAPLQVNINRGGVCVAGGEERETSILYIGDTQVYEYQNTIAITFDESGLLAIPLDQLDGTVREDVKEQLQKRMGPRYQKLETLPPWTDGIKSLWSRS